MQGKGGNITPWMTEQENLGFYKKEDPNTESIELLYPMADMEEVFLILSRLEERLITDNDSDILIVLYYNGESYLIDDKITVELGCGLISLEKMFDLTCMGAAHIKRLHVWDCSRKVQQLEAGIETKFLMTEELD